MKFKNLYLKIKILKKKKLRLIFFNKTDTINIYFYILNSQNNFNIKILKRFLYENGLQCILINNTFKIGLKYNYILNLIK